MVEDKGRCSKPLGFQIRISKITLETITITKITFPIMGSKGGPKKGNHSKIIKNSKNGIIKIKVIHPILTKNSISILRVWLLNSSILISLQEFSNLRVINNKQATMLLEVHNFLVAVLLENPREAIVICNKILLIFSKINPITKTQLDNHLDLDRLLLLQTHKETFLEVNQQ